MPRVAVNGRFLTRPITGVERHAREVTRRLADRARVLRPEGESRGFRGHLWEQISLPRQVNGDVLWSPANSGPLGVERQVVTLHDLSPLEHPEWFDRGFGAWYRFLVPRLARRVRRIITVSAFSRERIIERLGVRGDHVVVIPNGVDERFEPPRADITCDQQEPFTRRFGVTGPYVLTVGSLEPRKNLSVLCKAWQLSGLARDGCALVIAGAPGPSFRRANFGPVPAGVRLVGYVADEHLPKVYSEALAFVVVSMYEGFGLPALEAMACGTPVIAGRTGGLGEIAREAALLVDETDAESVASSMRCLHDRPALRRTLASRGRAYAARFSWQRTADEIWKVLEDVDG